MKLWVKVYLLTLVITAVFVNCGFLGVVYFTYTQMLEAEKARCEAEYVVMRESISRDIATMEEYFSLDSTYFRKYVVAYDSYYEDDTDIYGVVDDAIVAAKGKFDLLIPEDNGTFIKSEEHTTVYIAQILDTKHDQYRIIMRKTLYDFDKTWDTLQPVCIVGGIVLSLGVSLILAVAVRIVLKPLDKLEVATKEVQNGNWSTRVDIKGDHELAQLGRHFNAMADSVEENIEKLKEQSRQKQELINNLAHEMNTPITSIQGFADYMRISNLPKEEQIECLEFITGESRRLKEISSTLLSMARMQEGEPMQLEVFSVRDLCNKLDEVFTKSMNAENIEFDLDCEVEEMQGNEVLIESLLRNLIVNAYHAVTAREDRLVRDGHIEVKISKTNNRINDEGENREGIQMEVSDNGCGMSEEHIKQIFEPFYRVDKARSRENGGSGLGLPFCKKIVEMHKGSIKVESELQKGTKFIVNFTVS